MTGLQKILANYRNAALTEREKGAYFEELIVCYLKNEASSRIYTATSGCIPIRPKNKGWTHEIRALPFVAQTAGTGETSRNPLQVVYRRSPPTKKA